MRVHLEGADHLIDVKTLAAGHCHQANARNFGSAVEKRQVQVNTSYYATAKRFDTRLHDTPLGERGLFARTLFENGNRGGRVRGQVASTFGEASTDLGDLRGLYAQELASRHVDYFRMANSTGNGSTPFLELVTADSRSPPGLCGDTGSGRRSPLYQRPNQRRS